jgi:hypothetical protein
MEDEVFLWEGRVEVVLVTVLLGLDVAVTTQYGYIP